MSDHYTEELHKVLRSVRELASQLWLEDGSPIGDAAGKARDTIDDFLEEFAGGEEA